MKRFTCCILLLGAALWAAPARSQIFGSGPALVFDAADMNAFGLAGLAAAALTFTNTANPIVIGDAQTGATASTGTPASTGADTLALNPTIGGVAYQSLNGATYTKTATGLLVALPPAALTGSGPLAGHLAGLTIEIPDSVINQLF